MHVNSSETFDRQSSRAVCCAQHKYLTERCVTSQGQSQLILVVYQ